MTDFSETLKETLKTRKLSQRQLGDRLGVTRAAVNDWCQGRSVPGPEKVFAAEQALEVREGTLSRSLGYMPIGSERSGRASVTDAIQNDPRLDDTGREILTVVYGFFAFGKGKRGD